MPRTISILVLFAPAVLAACPSKPTPASLVMDDGPVPLIDGSIDTPGESPDSMPPGDGPNVIELGFPTPFAGERIVDDNDLVGFPIQVTVSQAGELVGWGVQSASGPPGTKVRMALYSNAGANQPATLLTQGVAWNLADGVLLTSGYFLNAGDYWLLVSVSETVSIGSSPLIPTESRECFRALLFTTAFPNPWGSGTCLAANPINIFIRIRPSA
jgi:hypothetical protein